MVRFALNLFAFLFIASVTMTLFATGMGLYYAFFSPN